MDRHVTIEVTKAEQRYAATAERVMGKLLSTDTAEPMDGRIFRHWLRGGVPVLSDHERKELMLSVRAQTVGTDSEGGYAAPDADSLTKLARVFSFPRVDFHPGAARARFPCCPAFQHRGLRGFSRLAALARGRAELLSWFCLPPILS
jgi:hypothetical protein